MAVLSVRRLALALVALAGAALAWIACGGPDVQDGEVVCGAGGFCPPGFRCSELDDRCYREPPEGTCGDGVQQTGETCDPPSSCPVCEDDGNACTKETTGGAAATCDVSCGVTVVESCEGGDGCCPSGCDANTDDDCSASCGDGQVGTGETCDPMITCPASCDDGNACTKDSTTGSAANCNVVCGHQGITVCENGDGCCPSGCTANTDDDCSASCGNGTVEAGETCDPPASCPTSCDDGNACTTDSQTGSSANCNKACGHQSIVMCKNDDGCCPAGCNSVVDNNCSTSCGNGTIEAGETCDPPGSCPTSCNDNNACTFDSLTGSAANCNSACSFTSIVTCGPNDGCCPNGCTSLNDPNCSSMCGNNQIDSGESCDPPAQCQTIAQMCNDGDACTIDIVTGSPATCNVVCSHQQVTTCGVADGCCPLSCSLPGPKGADGGLGGSDPDCTTTACDGGPVVVGADGGMTCSTI